MRTAGRVQIKYVYITMYNASLKRTLENYIKKKKKLLIL